MGLFSNRRKGLFNKLKRGFGKNKSFVERSRTEADLRIGKFSGKYREELFDIGEETKASAYASKKTKEKEKEWLIYPFQI